MCDSSYDCDFHAFGGLRDRQDRAHRRVSSIFDPATASASIVPPTNSETDGSLIEETTTDPNLESGADPNSRGSEDARELRNRLLDELEKMDDLPTIPKQPTNNGLTSETI